MADLFSLEGLQCPQYVNFSSGIEGSQNDVTEFVPSVSSPAIIKDAGQFKVPKLKTTNVCSTIKKTSVVQSSNITDSFKLNSKKMMSKRFSKSDGALNVESNVKQTAKKRLNYFGGHKRSLSENDLRIKKTTQPTTPMCLKRTINNNKTKKFKTTEEMELEIIAKLRQQTFKHLRANEITMKRQKMKQASNLQKESGISTIKVKKPPPVKRSQQDNPILEKIKDYTKNVHQKAQKEGAAKESASLHAETLKKINDLKKSRSATSNRFEKFLNPMPFSRVSISTFEKEGISAVMKNLPIKKSDAHAGLSFSVTRSKTAIKPFNFQDGLRDLSSNSKFEAGVKPKAQLNSILKTPQLIAKNKENISALKVSRCSAKPGKPQMEKKTEYRGFRY